MIQIGLHLFTTSMIDELPAHHTPGIGLTVFGRHKITLHIMDPLADNDCYLMDAFVQNNDIHRLTAVGIGDRYFFVMHDKHQPLANRLLR